MSTRLVRILIAAISFAVAVGGAWWVLRDGEPETVLIVDSRDAIARLLAAQNAELGELDPGAGLAREPLDRAIAEVFYPAAGADSYEYRPDCFFRLRPGFSQRIGFAEHPRGGWTSVANDHGMLGAADVRAEKPALRVLVTGDSHTAGLCAPEETFTSLLAGHLAETRGMDAVETLNAAAGGYDPWNYLGVLEAYADELAPDVFVPVIYGGNDFYGLLKLERWFHRRPPPKAGPYSREPLLERYKRGVVGQELSQVVHMLNEPADEGVAIATLNAITDEMARACEARGIALLCVYLPPPSRGQPARHAAVFEEALASIDADPSTLAVSDRMADAWLAHMAATGVVALDLRPPFAAAPEDLYWETDYHIDLDGQRVVASALAARLEELLP